MPAGRTYKLCRDYDTPPDGCIFLGSIIDDPSDPECSLNPESKSKLPASSISTSLKEGWSRTATHGRDGQSGIFTSFLNLIGVGIEASYRFIRRDGSVMDVRRLDTETFAPLPATVKEMCTSSPGVMEFLEASKFKKPIYMIVGRKIARGAIVSDGVGSGSSGKVMVGMDTTAAGIPFTVGPKGSLSSERTEHISFERSSDFVLAYRLRKINYSVKDGMFSSSAYSKGALLEQEYEAAFNPLMEDVGLDERDFYHGFGSWDGSVFDAGTDDEEDGQEGDVEIPAE